MEYNFSAIGQRIKELRKEKKWSQDQLIEMLQDRVPIGRNTLSAIENGNAKHFELSLLTSLCEIFDCEMGYLLCEYSCKTRAATDIQASTGLSEPAIGTLRNLTENETAFLDKLLEDRGSLYFIAASFVEFSKKRALNKAIDKGILNDDFGPATLEIKKDLDYSRFTLHNRFMAFVDNITK